MDPVNSGKPWTEAEDQSLRERFSYGISLRDLASLHGRTLLAIEWRLAKIAAEVIISIDLEDQSPAVITAVAAKYNVPESSIIKWLDTMNPYIPKHNVNAEVIALRSEISQLQRKLKRLSRRLDKIEEC